MALLAAQLVYAALERSPPVMAGQTGELLYAATFAGNSDEWHLYDGRQSARIVDEQLELALTEPGTAAWTSTAAYYGDFKLSVDLSAAAGPVDNAFGLALHIRDAQSGSCDLPLILFCGLEQLFPLLGAGMRQLLPSQNSALEYTAFLISSDGYYSLWSAADGEQTMRSAWIFSDAIRQGLGAQNHIEAHAQAGTYTFAINGEPVLLCLSDDPDASSTYSGGQCIGGGMVPEYRISAPEPGSLGILAQSTPSGGSGLRIRFDNFLVFAPGDAIEGVLRL